MQSESIRKLVARFGWTKIMEAHRMHTVDGEGATRIADFLGTGPGTAALVVRCGTHRVESVREGQSFVNSFDL